MGGALIQSTSSVIQADDGVIVIVDALFVDYSRINVSDITAAELVVDIGPFTKDQVTTPKYPALEFGNLSLLIDENFAFYMLVVEPRQPQWLLCVVPAKCCE